ncbi:TonB-dependent receptor plug domain-containing protein [Changchengzhania lutea]|uniref:TonB-dependent receptor plug domain-containing protein n=1 Tax=Changchengzhania lutea TaxID=2049305 RepID=UPI001FE4EE47|nr:TonB-dependent receptor plug domain-containing protein [Changchengzhania lutea]
MSKNFNFLIFAILFFLNVANLKAQTIQEEKQLLVTVLKTLETRYNISFSFADDTIKDKRIKNPDTLLSLEDVLNLLEKETFLDFQLLDNRFVVIKKIDQGNPLHRVQNLDEVIITNYLTRGITKLNDGSVTVKPDSFGILPGLIEPDVLQTIQALPGVMSIDETVSNINIRGGTHDQNLLLWDGIKMYQSGHFFGLISAFNPYITEQVTVYKNGTSAKYGDGISSIIDIQLPNKLDQQFKAGAGFNLINADVYAKIPLSKKTELQVSTRRSITDLITTPTYDQYFNRVFQDSDLSNSNPNSISKNESFYFYDITAKFLYDISKKDKIRFHFLNVNNRLDYEEQATINDRNEALNSNLSQQNLATGITYSRNWNPKLSSTAQVYMSHYDLDATNFDIINDQRLIQENEVYDGSFKLDMTYMLNNQFNINGGYQFTEVGISNLEDVNNPEFRSYIKEVIRSHSAYGETGFLSNNAKTKLTLGTRLNYINKFNMFFAEPRLSLSQRFFNYFRFELLGEFKSQTTSQIIDLQNDFLGIEKRRWVLSNNDNIPVIKSKQVSLGVHFNKNKLLISAEGYIKKVDSITTRSQGFQNQYQFTNSIGSYEIKGVDVLLNKQFNNVISTWISYSYSTNNYTFKKLNDGNSFPNNADVRHSITFGGTYTYNDLKVALGLNWHTGKPTTQPVTNDDTNSFDAIEYQLPNSTRIEDYLRADCSATYVFDISHKVHAQIGASVWNVLNKKNIINKYYSLDDKNEVIPVENQSLGITPNLSFRVSF